MADIVDRLRLGEVSGVLIPCDDLKEAADEIERLRAALKPFADYQLNLVACASVHLKPSDLKDCLWVGGFSGVQPEYRHFDQASKALEARNKAQGE